MGITAPLSLGSINYIPMSAERGKRSLEKSHALCLSSKDQKLEKRNENAEDLHLRVPCSRGGTGFGFTIADDTEID